MWNKLKFLMELLIYRVHLIGKQAILVDTPEHDNLGDQAITCAEKQFLSEIGVRYLELTASQTDWREKWFTKFTPSNKWVLVQGGGFLGSLWPNEEMRFRRILESFQQNKIVVFPQTVYFDGEDSGLLEDSIRIYGSHPNLTLLARETRTCRLLREKFPGVKTELVPDIVLAYRVKQSQGKREGVLLCLRNDEERLLSYDENEKILSTVRSTMTGRIRHTDTLCGSPVGTKQRERMVADKLSEFAAAELVVTDRLHGMIFSAITGTPCIAMQNSNGKVGAVYRWIENQGYIRMIDRVDELESALSEIDLHSDYVYHREYLDNDFEKIRNAICQ